VTPRRVRYAPFPPLFAVIDVATGLQLAALLSPENRNEYVRRHGWVVVE
jgi:hypothetical protein